MIKIFIESGVNAARKHDKETTNEQDFIVKVIAKHFPNSLVSVKISRNVDEQRGGRVGLLKRNHIYV